MNNEEKISFKNNDNYIIKLINKTYIDISNYLNNKYIIINNIPMKQNLKKD